MTTERKCVFSPCGKYRYTLWREWGDEALRNFEPEDPHHQYLIGNPSQYVQFIGLNPSTATDTVDDPTIRRCKDFARRWGFGAMCMTNLFAFRATDPNDMKVAVEPVGTDNDRWLLKIASEAGLVVAAWGNHGLYMGRYACVYRLLPNLHCFRVTKHRQPQHPLYMPSSSTPVPYLA